MATYATLQSNVADWLNRDDLTSQIKLFINIALRKIESNPRHTWKYMRKETSGPLVRDDYVIAHPTRYKKTKSLFIQNTDNRYCRLNITSLDTALRDWPYITDYHQFPEVFAEDDANTQVILRPTIDQSYTYQWKYYEYSAELTADGDTNWITDNYWELLLYGALFEAAVFMKDTEEQALFRGLFNERYKQLVETQDDIDWSDYELTLQSDYVV